MTDADWLLECIESTQDDGRRSVVEFQRTDKNTIVRETFEPEEKRITTCKGNFAVMS